MTCRSCVEGTGAENIGGNTFAGLVETSHKELSHWISRMHVVGHWLENFDGPLIIPAQQRSNALRGSTLGRRRTDGRSHKQGDREQSPADQRISFLEISSVRGALPTVIVNSASPFAFTRIRTRFDTSRETGG